MVNLADDLVVNLEDDLVVDRVLAVLVRDLVVVVAEAVRWVDAGDLMRATVGEGAFSEKRLEHFLFQVYSEQGLFNSALGSIKNSFNFFGNFIIFV